MYRTLAPWTQENPILMHVRKADRASVKAAVDQCVESEDANYIAELK